MLPLLLLPLLWAGSLQEDPGYKLQLQESVTVQAGLCALVSCSFSYPGGGRNPPSKLYISWYRDEGSAYYYGPVATNNPDRGVRTETRGRFHLVGDIRDNNCSLLIRDARIKDTGRYFLKAEIGRSTRPIYGDKMLTLQVTALTEKPVIHFLEPLESGRPTSLSCRLPGSCEGGRPLLFSWRGAATGSMDPRALQSSVLSLTPRPQDHDTNLTCQVQLQGAEVTTERTVQLNVSYAPQNLSVRIFFRNSTALLEGQALLLCHAQDSNPAAQLSWFRGPPTRNASRVSDTGVLDLRGVGAAEGEAFTCRAQNALGSRNVSVSLSYPPRLLGPSCSWEAKALRCRCSSRAWPAPALHWRLGEGLLEGNSSNASLRVASSMEGPWANSSLSLHGALSSGLRLSCEAQNAHGIQSATVLLLPGNSGPGAVLAALGGAGAGALLSLCLCLIFFCIVKSYRKHRTEKLADMDNKDPVMGTVTWGPRQKSCGDSPGDQACPAGGALPREQQELHYASLSFHGTTPGREATSSTEYSEIKPGK